MKIKYLKNHELIYLIWFGIGVFISIISYALSHNTDSIKLFTPLIISIMFICIQYLFVEKKQEKFVINFLSGISVFLVILLSYRLYKTYLTIPDWDFLSFYLYSLAGQSGGNFYDPALFNEIFSNLANKPPFRSNFIEACVNVGFVYPPPTMFLLYPLAWVDLQTGFIIWQSIMIAFLVIAVYLLANFFSKENNLTSSRIINLLVIINLILLFPNLLQTIRLSQTNTAFLVFLLLMLKKPDHWSSGVMLILLIMIKPLAIFLSVYFIIQKNWKVLTVAFISGIIALLSTGFIFGFDIYLNYFSSPPTDRMPEWVFSESVNNSLSAHLIRFNQEFFNLLDNTTLMIFTIFIGILLLIVTSVASWQLSRKSSLLSFVIFIPLSLVIYPGTLSHYSIFLIPVILCVFEIINTKVSTPVSLSMISITIIYITGFFGLFYLNLLLLIILFYWAFKDRINLLMNNILSKT